MIIGDNPVLTLVLIQVHDYFAGALSLGSICGTCIHHGLVFKNENNSIIINLSNRWPHHAVMHSVQLITNGVIYMMYSEVETMFKISNEQYLTLTHNSDFIDRHSLDFLKDLKNLYRNNEHLSPFLYDINAFADNPVAPEIILIKKGTNLSISANAECDTYDKALYEFITGCFNENGESLWLHLSTESVKSKVCALFSKYNSTDLNRYNFRLNRDFFNKLPDWRSQIPTGFTIEYFDTKSVDFRKKFGKTDDAFFPESKRFAFVTLFEDKIISECFSVLVDENMVEIGIHTYDENFRRKGLAFLTAFAFTEHCVDNNLDINWGCDYNNSASIALAKKLGYELFNEEIGVSLTKK